MIQVKAYTAVEIEFFSRREKQSIEKILTRMKDVELICELMVSIQQGAVINKKAAMDSAMRQGSFTAAEARKVSARTVSALNRVRRIFPDLRNTRFKKISDFYSLAILIAEFEREGLVLTDRRQNLLARKLLEAFGTGVDQVRKAEGSKRN